MFHTDSQIQAVHQTTSFSFWTLTSALLPFVFVSIFACWHLDEKPNLLCKQSAGLTRTSRKTWKSDLPEVTLLSSCSSGLSSSFTSLNLNSLAFSYASAGPHAFNYRENRRKEKQHSSYCLGPECGLWVCSFVTCMHQRRVWKWLRAVWDSVCLGSSCLQSLMFCFFSFCFLHSVCVSVCLACLSAKPQDSVSVLWIIQWGGAEHWVYLQHTHSHTHSPTEPRPPLQGCDI